MPDMGPECELGISWRILGAAPVSAKAKKAVLSPRSFRSVSAHCRQVKFEFEFEIEMLTNARLSKAMDKKYSLHLGVPVIFQHGQGHSIIDVGIASLRCRFMSQQQS